MRYVAHVVAVLICVPAMGQPLPKNTTTLKTLTTEQAELLAIRHRALYLNGLTSLSDDLATVLGRHEGVLVLDSLTTLSDSAAESLANHRGELSLDGLAAISVAWMD